MSEPLRVGVVGAGAIAQIAHLPVLAALDDVELVAVCDNDAAKAGALASRFGAPNSYDDIEDLLAYGQPDAVVICTPNHLHEIHVVTALRAGAAVLCERPLGLSVQGIEKIIGASHKANRTVMVALNHRYRSDIQAVRTFAIGGELGPLRAVRTGWYQFRPTRSGMGWRQRSQQAGGGAMLDLGLPLLDVALWIAGRPSPVRVTATMRAGDEGGVEDAASVFLQCADGCSVFVDVSWHYFGDAERMWLDVMGDDGSARIGPLRVFKELHGAPVNVTPTGAAGGENVLQASYRAEWATFVASARGVVKAPPLEDQLFLQRALDAIYESAREGRTVTV